MPSAKKVAERWLGRSACFGLLDQQRFQLAMYTSPILIPPSSENMGTEAGLTEGQDHPNNTLVLIPRYECIRVVLTPGYRSAFVCHCPSDIKLPASNSAIALPSSMSTFHSNTTSETEDKALRLPVNFVFGLRFETTL